MAFFSVEFAYFFVAAGTIAWALRHNRTLQKSFLLLASYVFYTRWDPRLFLILASASLANWIFGELIARCRPARQQRLVLVTGIVVNVAVLGVFKFYDFFRASLASFAEFLGLSAHLPILEIFLPVGISFYTFQGIAYLVDTYRGQAVRPRTVVDFLLFMSLFPQLLAGPICRSRELLPQIMADAPNRIERPAEAIALIASGIFKKVVLASYLSTHMVDEAFQIPTNYSSLELLVALFAYTVEVYLDFSGYTDMARGLGLLLGFRLPENFRHPYAASNIGEFWNRWHITFSTWLRDYIYFPLGGSRRSRLRTYANLIITFLICGIWHGPRWGFVIWGLLHGIALALYKFSVDLRRDLGRDPKGPHPWWWRAAGCVSTITFCAFARIFFRTEDISTAWEFFEGLGRVSMHGVGIDAWLVAITIFGFGMNFFGRTCYDQFLRTYERLPTITRPVLWAAISLAVLTFKTRDVSPHIYFGF